MPRSNRAAGPASRWPPHSSPPPVVATRPRPQPTVAATKITVASTSNARADAKTYLAQLCPKPIGGELNFMVWEGYTDTLFAKPFEDACGVKINATYMGSSDDLVAKLRAGGAQTIDLVSPSSRRDHPDHRGRARPAARPEADAELRRSHGQFPGPDAWPGRTRWSTACHGRSGPTR